uniref:Major facilitator superfamily (MFS) profile domain-containing protein n=1 Tax=Lactuca sativa TaxID=4236 RepID=A0A9R1UWN1_LACSA|nr:hypothetical protein LSAT_V11C800443730 [Lactuca sativa]
MIDKQFLFPFKINNIIFPLQHYQYHLSFHFFISWVIFNTLFGVSVNYWIAIVTRFLLGFLNGILVPIKAYACQLFPEEHQALGLLAISTSWGIGLIISPTLGGYLAQVYISTSCREISFSSIFRFSIWEWQQITTLTCDANFNIYCLAFVSLFLHFLWPLLHFGFWKHYIFIKKNELESASYDIEKTQMKEKIQV